MYCDDGDGDDDGKDGHCIQTEENKSVTSNLSFILQVVGMTYTEEYFRWDTNDQGNDDFVFGTHPYPGDTDNNILLDFCYYEPLQDEDV